MSFGLRRALGISKKGGGQDYLNDALAAYRTVQNPDINQQIIGNSAMSTIDPTGRNATLSALQRMQEISDGGGMTAIDKSRLQKIQDQTATQARGARQAIAENAAQRGIGGSGFELAQAMLGQQAASDSAARQAVDVNSAAQQRALEAMQATGQLGGQLNQHDMSRANAIDEIKKFNAGLRQQQFENDMSRANGMANAYTGKANIENERQKRQTGLIGGLMSSGGQILGAFA